MALVPVSTALAGLAWLGSVTGEPAKAYLNNIAQASGLVKIAEAEGEAALLRHNDQVALVEKRIEDAERLTDLELGAMVRIRNKLLNEQKRIVSVTEKTLPLLGANDGSELTEDFMYLYFDVVKDSEESMEDVLAKVMAREVEEPGSIPRSLLRILDRMDARTLSNFEALNHFRLSVHSTDSRDEDEVNVLYLNFRTLGLLELVGLSYRDLMELESLGLTAVSGPEAGVVCHLVPWSDVLVSDGAEYFKAKLTWVRGGEYCLPIGNVHLTRSGEALMAMYSPRHLDGVGEKARQILEDLLQAKKNGYVDYVSHRVWVLNTTPEEEEKDTKEYAEREIKVWARAGIGPTIVGSHKLRNPPVPSVTDAAPSTE